MPSQAKPGAADVFNRGMLQTICEMAEADFPDRFGLTVHTTAGPAAADWYAFRDNGADILAVAHLDTVAQAHKRHCHFVECAAGPVVFSRALDDRLGAYIILDMLPKLGVNVDVLLTVGEEIGASTAADFDPPKDYAWMIEFDRGGTDVVMYQYEDVLTNQLVRNCGATVGDGLFSDISMLDHLECKGFNWGVGYQEYHTARSHAFLADTFKMVNRFLMFHEQNQDVYLPHEDRWSALRKPESEYEWPGVLGDSSYRDMSSKRYPRAWWEE